MSMVDSLKLISLVNICLYKIDIRNGGKVGTVFFEKLRNKNIFLERCNNNYYCAESQQVLSR